MATPQNEKHPFPLTPFLANEEILADAPYRVEDYGDIRIIDVPPALTNIEDAADLKAAINEQLSESGAKKVVVKLRDTVEVRADHVGIILGAQKRAKKHKKEIIIGGPLSDAVQAVIDLGLVGQHVKVANLDLPDALKHL